MQMYGKPRDSRLGDLESDTRVTLVYLGKTRRAGG
jgi:hypothetical protein